jgi:hypothetical protein
MGGWMGGDEFGMGEREGDWMGRGDEMGWDEMGHKNEMGCGIDIEFN